MARITTTIAVTITIRTNEYPDVCRSRVRPEMVPSIIPCSRRFKCRRSGGDTSLDGVGITDESRLPALFVL